ncbi:MAG: terminase large subunit [Sphaerochaetaceae bacterium]
MAELTAKQYIDDVLSGRIVVCKFVYLAVKRHVDDLKKSKRASYPYEFNEQLATRSIDFAQLLKHSKGEWARRGETIKLEAWQQFIKWVLHGWVKKGTTLRRFTKAYIEVARKNGKTTFAATEVLDIFFLDREPGAEIYLAATKREQAKICWTEVQKMATKHPILKKRIDVLNHSSAIRTKGGDAVIKALGADSDTEDGLNPLMAIIDEYHAHKTSDMVNVIESGMGAREQPLLEIITTAGVDQYSPCYQEERDLAVRVLEGEQADSFFAIIFTLDKGDDWTDPSVWVKANPNLGVSVKLDYMQKRVELALSSPRKQNDVKTKNLNIWCNAATAWITSERWDACGGKIDANELIGRTCYAGMDLAVTTDLSAVALVFPPINDEKKYMVLMKFYLPENLIDEKSKTDKVPYTLWRDHGWLTPTPGDIIDQDYIETDILKSCEEFNLVQVGYDRYNSTQIVSNLIKEEIDMIPVAQNFSGMSPLAKNFEYMIAKKLINPGNNPVLAWNNHCCEIESNAEGNIKPKKPDIRKTGKRIDGIIALIMALGLAMGGSDDEYDDGEQRFL